MYGWMWRQLPGPLPLRLVLVLLAVVAVVLVLFIVVFPVLAPHLPFSHVTVDTSVRPAP